MSDILKAFLENEPAIRRYLARFSDQAHDIDEIVQETFLRGFSAEMRRDIQEPKAYLFQIARNVALERKRKNQRAPIQAIEDLGGSDLIIDEKQLAADEWLDGRRKLTMFAMAVAKLPPQCRKAFLLRRVEGLRYKQIANRMNISVSAVEKHVATGILKCSDSLLAAGYQPAEFGAGDKKQADEASPDTIRDDMVRDE